MEGLAIFAPAGTEHSVCHRVRFLDPKAARYLIFVHDANGYEQLVDPGDYTNLDTRLDTGGRPARVPRAGQPEAWLEARVRADIESLDATLLTQPVYGQVAQFAGGDRGIIDLLAVDRDGRLAVIELKVDQDIHLPLQALDYWMRVKWHLDRGEIAGSGHFTGIRLGAEAPRLLLVAPAMEFHPSNETVLGFFSAGHSRRTDRFRGTMEARAQGDVSSSREDVFRKTMALAVLRQIRQALATLNPRDLRELADRPVKVGLIAPSADALGADGNLFCTVPFFAGAACAGG